MRTDRPIASWLESSTERPRLFAATFLVALLSCCSVTAPSAVAEDTHLFDATLSLTGGCALPSPVDPVPDPGCPGGAHPPKPFSKHLGVAVDLHGNRFILSAGGNPEGTEGRIDVFNSSGEFITRVAPVRIRLQMGSIAVDSEGRLYVSRWAAEDHSEDLVRYEPTKYNPAAGEIEYADPPVPVVIPSPFGEWGVVRRDIAVDPLGGHLFVGDGSRVFELTSATEGNELFRSLAWAPGMPYEHSDGGLDGGIAQSSIAVDAVRGRIYVSDTDGPPIGGSKSVIKVFDLEAPADVETDDSKRRPRDLLFTIDGSTTPTGKFISEPRVLTLAVDEASGHVFVGDLEAPTRRVYEFDADGNPVSTLEGKFEPIGVNRLQMAFDDSPTSPTQGYLFVPSGNAPGYNLAFAPKATTEPPVVEGLSVTGASARDVILRGKVNPKGEEITYRIELTSEQDFQLKGFEGATLAREGTLKPAGEGIAVSAPVAGLSPGTSYRFRIVAESGAGQDEADSSFATYALPKVRSDCPNQALRTGLSALLPDCRAYELVTPADTNGHPPFVGNVGPFFPTRLASPEGSAVSFQVAGGVIPGTEGTGGYLGDPYVAMRGDAGWRTEAAGPSGAFISGIATGSPSPDQAHLVWWSNGSGPADLEERTTLYVRYPDGRHEPVGRGSLATDPAPVANLIAENASHIIFTTGGSFSSRLRLEPNAPPDGTEAIYDRTPDGTLHVVSLLPGDLTPEAGQDAGFKGASLDGEGVAFTIGDTLYLRHDNQATYAIGENLTFAGLAEGGERVFYMKEGDLEAFDVSAGVIEFSQSGDVTPVNVAADGSGAYFVSPSVLVGDPNPAGDTVQPGERNLYLSREGQISFVGTLSQRDVDGLPSQEYEAIRGLGTWLDALVGTNAWGLFAVDPSRTTADGEVLLFESKAPLTDHDPEGHTQVYRFDAGANTLRCLSCNPVGASTGDATLQSLDTGFAFLEAHSLIDNLSRDGGRAFFESTEALVVSDTDNLRDVYEWEEQGTDECQKPGGCLYLISSGQSGRDDFLYAASDTGDDVFIWTADLLLPASDPDETPSIYDARVGGGFPPPQGPAGECLGEACQPVVVAPGDPTPMIRGAGNVVPKKAGKPRCPKGKKAVRKRGKGRCVPRKKKQPNRANAHRRAHR